MVDHTFVICAYKESPYLESCILSLKGQTIPSKILMTTSTPNMHIQKLAEKYSIPLFINKGETGIAQDWNFAYGQANTKYVTIAHQDDYYEPQYLENILRRAKKAKRPIILFTEYGELRAEKKVDSSVLLKIKRIMLLPLRVHALSGSRFVKRLSIRFGNPVCCPATTYVREMFSEAPFQVKFSSNVDWMMLERMSKRKGEFCYVSKIEMYHRIHEESTTTEIIQNDTRWREDFEMFCKFWPAWIAKLLTKLYRLSEKSNEIK